MKNYKFEFLQEFFEWKIGEKIDLGRIELKEDERHSIDSPIFIAYLLQLNGIGKII